MECKTTNKAVFTGAKGKAASIKKDVKHEVPKPVQTSSSYKASFVDWNNGKNDIFHEKHPQYPYYSLPFQGQTSYQKTHTKD